MTTGQKIKQRRLELDMTVDELAEKINKNRTTIYRYESDSIDDLPSSVLKPLAEALETTPAALMGWDEPVKKGEYPFLLEAKLRQLGYSVGFYEEDAVLWINYPDGMLEVTTEDLRKLENSTLSYLQFNLEELKKQRINDFRFNKKE